MTGASASVRGGLAPCVVVYHGRERVRQLVRAAFPRRRARLVMARSADDVAQVMRATLVDAAVVDLGGAPSDDGWRVAGLAREFPSVSFFGTAPLRAAEGPALAHCAGLGLTDLLVEGVDDAALRDVVLSSAFSTRFDAALREPPTSLALTLPLQRAAWRAIVAGAGRPVRTSELAARLGVTREHLSRTFASDGAPNLKRVIDLVRLIAAAELAKNPGYDVRDVAVVLEFASSAHLASTAQRVVGTKPGALARLRTVDLVDRFLQGHGRSRKSP